MTTPTDLAREPSPTRLALLLGLGLLAVVALLTLAAPTEGIVDLERLARLVDDHRVVRLEVGEEGVTARLTAPVALDDGGGRRQVEAVILPGPLSAPVHEALAHWEAVGVTVVPATARPATWRAGAWVSVVGLLLAVGLYHLVAQARRYRREGSPRQHLQRAREDLEAGRITPEEYERRAEVLSIEM